MKTIFTLNSYELLDDVGVEEEEIEDETFVELIDRL